MRKILVLLVLLLTIPNLVKAQDYLTFTSNQDDSKIGITGIAGGAKIQYNIGDGWVDASTSTSITLNSGKSVQFKGDYSNATINSTSSTWFDISGNVSVSGDINTLIDGVGGNIELKDYIYYHLFNGCEGLTDASNLKFPSKNLKPYSYASMFQGCTGLISAPKELPAANLAKYCYNYMFNGCTSLTTAPELLATTLADVEGCYSYMFYGCTSLTTAPELKATTLASYCYRYMFQGCTSLTSAPELKAIELRNNCYQNMFEGCTSLTTAPELRATTLAYQCYQNMFKGCTNLNKISVNFTDWNTSNSSTTNWVDGVAASGNFVCPKELEQKVGVSNIPNGWTVKHPDYLTFTSNQDDSKVGFESIASGVKIQYNDGDGWKDADENTSITLANGKSVKFRGDYSGATLGEQNYTRFSITGKVSASGDVNTLIDGVGGDINLKSYVFYNLFLKCTGLTDASKLKLPSKTLANNCYEAMFNHCGQLTTTPEELPAIVLAGSCYSGMFNGCTSLTTAPEKLPATTLANDCYYYMFTGCTNLTTAPELPATSLASNCYYAMFYQCTNLTKAPKLPAASLASNCYYFMFASCANLNYIEVNFTDWNSSQSSTTNWVYNVASTGAFICPSELADVRGTSNIPTDWKRPEYLTFTSNQDGSKVGFVKIADGAKIEYKEGDGWKDASELKTTPLTLNSGQSVKFRGDYSNVTTSKTVYTQFDITGNVSASGDVNTLIDCVGGDIELSSYNYSRMFMECAGLTDASGLKLPSTTMSESCCYQMFSACSALTKAPDLKATQMATRCYQEMFNLCTSLTEAPKLPANNLADYCYADMFHSCSALTVVQALPATVLSESCYSYMFVDCKSLIVAPALRATTLAKNCYKSMFKDCSSLFYVSISKCLSAFDNNYTSEWLSGVAKVGIFSCGDITKVSDIKRGANYIPEGWYVGSYYVALSEDNINEGLSLSKSKYYNKDLEGMLAKMPTYQQMPDNYIDNMYSMDDTIKVNPENYEIYNMFYQSSPTADPVSVDYDKTNNTFAVSSLQNGQFVITISGSKLYQVKYYSNDMELGAEINQNDKTPIVFRKGAKKSDLQSFSIDGCFPEIYTNVECTKELGDDELLVSYCDNGLVKLYKKPIEYTITFDTDGGNSINPIKYTIESETIDLSSYKGEKEGYHFVKWVDDKDAEVTQIVKGSFGNVELTALFEAHSFTKYTYNNDATTETDGTETAVCDHEGCNAIDVRIAKGTKLTSIANEIVNSLVIYAHHNTIVVENAEEDIFIYDIDGRCVANRDAASHVSITMQREGIYIVKCGNTVKRVLVM